MGQTPQGLPWPEPTAPVRDGSAAIRALAEAVSPRTPYEVLAGSGGYATNSNGGISITTPFNNVVVGLAASQYTAAGYLWQRASGAPPGTIWFQFIDPSGNTVPNSFGILDFIVMGYRG